MKIQLRSSIVIALSICTTLAFGQTEKTKDINESWSGITRVKVDHRHGPLEVIPGTGQDVRLEAQIMVRAKEAADAQLLIDHLDVSTSKFSDELEIKTSFETKSWNTINNNTKVKFKDGTKATGILDYDIKFKLHIPQNMDRIELSNKYNDIEISSDVTADVRIKQYDASVRVHNVSGEFTLEIKYGKCRAGNVGLAVIDLYDSELELESAEDVSLKSKYSEFSLGSIGNADISSYDGKGEITTINGNLKLEDKYSEFTFGGAQDVQVSLYDGKLKIGPVGKFSGKSKYNTVHIESADAIDLEASYDDEYFLGTTGSFACIESKYSSFELQSLSKGLSLKSYDDKISVSEVKSSFELLDIECKYTNLKLPLGDIGGYQLEAKTKYGSLKYDEPTDNSWYKKDNDELDVKASIGAAGATAKVKISAYDSQIRLL